VSVDWSGRRALNALGLAACLGGLGVALLLEHVVGLEPCPLCIMQRAALIGLGLVFLIAWLHGPGVLAGRCYAAVLLLVAGAGAAVATRHLWLQQLSPEQVPACGPGLDFLLDAFPLREALVLVFQGSGECAEVHTLLGLSLPGWTLLAFVALAGFGVWANAGPRARAA
jgi:protein dithiol:quinone oxidoreductase